MGDRSGGSIRISIEIAVFAREIAVFAREIAVFARNVKRIMGLNPYGNPRP
jgi:hypothetical protein